MATATAVELEVFSDVVCPWCAIGRRRLERALAEEEPGAVRVRWRAFQLDPFLPAEGIDERACLAAKFGGEERLDAAQARVTELAAAEGLAFRLDLPGRRAPNTRLAHRAVKVAEAAAAGVATGAAGVGGAATGAANVAGAATGAADVAGRADAADAAVAALFTAFFAQGADLGDLDVVVAVVAEASGLDAGVLRAALLDGAGEREVDEDVALARALGITGVPLFVADRRVAVSGAQDPATLRRLLAIARGEEE